MELTRSATRVRAFWLYWSSSATSSVGSAVGAVALPLSALLAVHATAFEMGLISASSYAAWLVIGLPAGVITQRLPLRRLQVAMDLARALAIASVPLAWLAETGADPGTVNVNGGAIALGHPLGATGARLMTTLLHELERTGGRYGLQTMCEGGGQANVTILERLPR